ncbi:hypothetical protein HYX05_03020 [Candidatus Woesearchaeota archaeon]|nr:hypothetical protein [Candidatus Woesearchaeota archaeon]
MSNIKRNFGIIHKNNNPHFRVVTLQKVYKELKFSLVEMVDIPSDLQAVRDTASATVNSLGSVLLRGQDPRAVYIVGDSSYMRLIKAGNSVRVDEQTTPQPQQIPINREEWVKNLLKKTKRCAGFVPATVGALDEITRIGLIVMACGPIKGDVPYSVEDWIHMYRD